MPKNTQLQSAGDYNLDSVLIVGSSGKRINVIDQVGELNVYQSLDSPFMSGNILLYDSSILLTSILGANNLSLKYLRPIPVLHLFKRVTKLSPLPL